MNDVFLSYAREDREVVEQLAAAIDDAGLAVWWDKNIEPGTRFDKVLENELHKSRCVVVAWSQNSIDSDWVCSEAHEGFERGILMPVMLESVSPPLPFKRMQSADLHGWPARIGSDSEFELLLNGIRRVLLASNNNNAPARSATPDNVAKAKTSVAVLPFTDRSGNADDEYLADGRATGSYLGQQFSTALRRLSGEGGPAALVRLSTVGDREAGLALLVDLAGAVLGR